MGFKSINVVNQMGEGGGQYSTGTSALTPPTGKLIVGIYAHTASSVAAVSANISGTLSAVAIPAGSSWLGQFSSVTPASGTLTVYYSKG